MSSVDHIPTKLLTAWWNHKIRRGGVLHRNKKFIIRNLRLIIPGVDKTGVLKTWNHFALDYRYWRHLISGLITSLTSNPFPPIPLWSALTNPPLPPPTPTPPPSPVNINHWHTPHQQGKGKHYHQPSWPGRHQSTQWEHIMFVGWGIRVRILWESSISLRMRLNKK